MAMPTYDYECPKCGHKFEKFQLISEPALTRCPQPRCKGRVKRLIGTGAGLIFKGSGFYTTDYRSSGYKEAAKKESDGGKPAAAKTETKTDSKPAASGKHTASKT
jgi:putative FmdB family regulatory protein